MVVDGACNEQLSAQQIVKICDRHRGVGADGVLLVEPATNGANFRMRYYNSDGGEAEMCGNGARWCARFVEKVADAGKKVSFETPAGIIAAQLHGELVTLNMSKPTDLRLTVRLPIGYETKTIHFVNTGVPHVVIPVVNIEEIDVLREGAAIRRHEMFSPKGANVNFLERLGGNKIAIRTYERGVENETLACGTGVVASAVIFAATEKTGGPIGVLVRGGSELNVDFRRDGEGFTDVTLTGPAEFAFEGTIEL